MNENWRKINISFCSIKYVRTTLHADGIIDPKYVPG